MCLRHFVENSGSRRRQAPVTEAQWEREARCRRATGGDATKQVARGGDAADGPRIG